ncbi:MAG: DUF433 domain-containing protein [Nitrospiria bacterium]
MNKLITILKRSCVKTRYKDRIELSPKIMLGDPVIRQTCITIELILRKLSERATV